MGIWPFRRKSSRKRTNSGDVAPSADTTMHTAGSTGDAGRHNGVDGSPERRKSRKAARGSRRVSREPKKLQRDPERRTYSFSPGRNDTIRVPADAHREHPVPPLPPKAAMTRAATWDTQGLMDSYKNAQDPASAQEWRRVPTLHKRSAQDLPRRKSSKKRKEDHQREEEVKAMSSFMPTRPATLDDASGRPMKRDSKKMRDGLNRDLNNPSSDISLPLQESLHSSLSSNSERHASYKLKGIDVFSPRPTIRYAENPRYGPSRELGAADTPDIRRRRLADRDPIPEETMKANKRIEELADDLNAGDLRELMERDQRRRDRKKTSDQQKMQRKLTRRAERQKAAELEAAQNGTSPPKNMERGVMGRELPGLGITTGGAASSVGRKLSNASSRRRGKRPVDYTREDSNASVPSPMADFQRSESLPPTEAGSPVEEREEPIIATAQVARLSRASMSPPASPTGRAKGHTRGASSISQMMDLNKATPALPTSPERPEPGRTSSEVSARNGQSWTSFFKRNKNKRASIPSSFSNTSRESALAASRPSQTYEVQRSTSNVPKRTMSKFREDLPDFPISPPDSRVQSPEADEVPPIHAGFPEKRGGGRESSEISAGDPISRIRHDTPTSGYRSLEAASRLKSETPTSGHRSTELPSPEPSAIMSQSLASIDSEGSWLSGRPRGGSKRGSVQITPQTLRKSASSLEKQYREYGESAEELGIAEDEYFSRLTPGADDMFEKSKQRRASGNPMPSSDEEDGDSLASPSSTKWGAVGRRPTVVHHETRAKSREGLLNDYIHDASDSDDGDESPQDMEKKDFESEGEGQSQDPIQRATSFNIKSHARHMSAGSAKLLDVKPRGSGDIKRLSSDSRGAQ